MPSEYGQPYEYQLTDSAAAGDRTFDALTTRLPSHRTPQTDAHSWLTALPVYKVLCVRAVEQVSSSAVVRRHWDASSVEWWSRLRRRWRADPTQLSPGSASRYSPRPNGARSQRPGPAARQRAAPPSPAHRQPAAAARQQQQRRRRQRRRGAFSWPSVDSGQLLSRRRDRCPADLASATTTMTTTTGIWWCSAAAATAASSYSASACLTQHWAPSSAVVADTMNIDRAGFRGVQTI